MTTAEDIKTARDIVAERWHKGNITDGRGNVCAVGALNLACYGQVHSHSEMDDTNRERREVAYEEVRRHLPDPHLHVAEYNDAIGTTREDIINLFDKTLADMGAL